MSDPLAELESLAEEAKGSKEKTAASQHHSGHRQRLRERFLSAGPAALADYELLEMLLFAAHPRGDVKPLAKALLKRFGNIAEVLHATPVDLATVEDCNESAICAIKCASALAERMLKAEVTQRPVISSWTTLLDYCRVAMGHKKTEEFRVLYLNSKNELIADVVQQQGTVDHAPIYPREVVKKALDLGAVAFIMVHNHPSGDPSPSKDDIEITRQVIAAAAALDVRVHDHLIIGRKGHFSFKSHGLM